MFRNIAGRKGCFVLFLPILVCFSITTCFRQLAIISNNHENSLVPSMLFLSKISDTEKVSCEVPWYCMNVF